MSTSTSPSTDPPSAPAPTTSTSPKLPPLSAAEFREYNRMAEHMDMFHAHFRSTWEVLYTSASSNRRAQGLSIRSFIQAGLDFVSHLETHHAIEERFVFPDLAVRMPEFRTGKERNLPAFTPKIIEGETLGNEGEKESEKEKEAEEKGKKKAAELLQQHKEIHHGMEGLKSYLQGCLRGESELQMSALKTQLDTWGAVLWKHLDQEVKTLGADNMRRYWTLEEMRRMRM
ncbi:hypothetical protein F4808DRAFT_430746 [Astrocystis sublimbata]|nr:hypothetical protein F4808DRAFT_430746 [Astrocystis sublimbata]